MKVYPSRSQIITAMQNPKVSFKAKALMGGSIIRKGSMIVQYAGGYTTTFPFLDQKGKKIAVRCWIADIGDAQRRCREIAAHLQKLNIQYFSWFEMIEEALLINGTLYPVVVMDWVEGQTLKHFLNANISAPDKIKRVAEKFREMVAYLHSQQMAHGDLQHGNILVKPNGDLAMIDYDSMYIASLQGMEDIIKGLPGYQHPGRTANKLINPKLDYFSELVIYLALLVFAEYPGWWPRYKDTDDLLFSKEDLNNPYGSELIAELGKSSSSMIRLLVQRMIEALTLPDIQSLEPLEVAMVDKLAASFEEMIGKYKNQPHPPKPKPIILPKVDDFSKKSRST